MTKFRQETINLVGGAVALGLVAILAFLSWALVFREIPLTNETGMSILLGILSAQVSVVVGFYFGTSSVAKRQTETIDKLADTAAAAQAATNPAPAKVLEPGESATIAAKEPVQ